MRPFFVLVGGLLLLIVIATFFGPKAPEYPTGYFDRPAAVVAPRGQPSAPPELPVSVETSRSFLRLRNNSTHDLPELTILVNGDYSSAYRCTTRPIAGGETIMLPLDDFVRRNDGRRFDSAAYSVTQVMVLGDGYASIGRTR